MKHPSSRAYSSLIGTASAAMRARPTVAISNPAAVRELLGDIFVLSYDHDGGYPFRVAGTRALRARRLRPEGHELCGAVYAAEPPRDRGHHHGRLPRKRCPRSPASPRHREDGATAHLELLLLPFNTRAHAPLSLTGVLAPFESDFVALTSFQLTSWRYLHPPPQKLMPRALRKLAIARGFMVYEGLR